MMTMTTCGERKEREGKTDRCISAFFKACSLAGSPMHALFPAASINSQISSSGRVDPSPRKSIREEEEEKEGGKTVEPRMHEADFYFDGRPADRGSSCSVARLGRFLSIAEERKSTKIWPHL